MSRCTIVRAVQVAIFIVSIAGGGVARADVSLGASFGYTHLTYPDTPHFTNDVIGIPGTEVWAQPGIRVGYLAHGSNWDVVTDIGLVHRSGTIGSTETTFQLLPQVQLNGSERGGIRPFLNAGVGIVHESADTSPNNPISATRPVFGAGIGARKSVSDGHGLVRLELRYDRLSEQSKVLSPSSTFTFPATNMFSVKFGFDLLVAR